MEQVNGWKTTDGRFFTDESKAISHQKDIDREQSSKKLLYDMTNVLWRDSKKQDYDLPEIILDTCRMNGGDYTARYFNDIAIFCKKHAYEIKLIYHLL